MRPGRRFAALSIRQKLTMMAMLASASALLLACVTFVIVDVYFQRGGVVRNLDTLAKIVGMNSTAALPSRLRRLRRKIRKNGATLHELLHKPRDPRRRIVIRAQFEARCDARP